MCSPGIGHRGKCGPHFKVRKWRPGKGKELRVTHTANGQNMPTPGSITGPVLAFRGTPAFLRLPWQKFHHTDSERTQQSVLARIHLHYRKLRRKCQSRKNRVKGESLLLFRHPSTQQLILAVLVDHFLILYTRINSKCINNLSIQLLGGNTCCTLWHHS